MPTATLAKTYWYLIRIIKQLPTGQLLYLHFDLVNFVKIMPIMIESLSTISQNYLGKTVNFSIKSIASIHANG